MKKKSKFPDPAPAKVKLTEKRSTKRVIKAVSIIVLITIVLFTATPFIAIPVLVNRHVNYKGYETTDYPLQGIYKATDFGLSEKQMYLKTEDGLNIWCSEIYTRQPKALIIYLTGIMQPSVTYFYGHAKYMQEQGYASILLEVRGHGNSEGSRICLGYEEAYDVKAAVKYVKSQEKYKNVPIVLHGVSMGGAISINSFGQILDIDALIAMSAYSSFEDVVIDLAEKYPIPKFLGKLEKPLIRSALKTVFGSRQVDEMKPVEQIKNSNGRPVLLIACTEDANVPAASLLRLKEANPSINIWLRNSWEHFIIKDCDFRNVRQDTEYWNVILEFLNQAFPD